MPATCPVCDGPLPPPAPTGRPRRWCSRPCRRVANGRPPDVVRREQEAQREELDLLNSYFRRED
jgi:hypothetical protein